MNTNTTKLISLIALGLAIGAGSASAQQGPSGIDPQVSLSDIEISDLVYMREEEKLARDTYQTFAGQWSLAIFSNIAKSEQRHTDALEALLEAYGVSDPVVEEANIGSFTDPELQVLYDDLVAAGMQSELDALKVGGAIEETDIIDLVETIAHTENPDLIATYENLLCGSRNHLRAFVGQIELTGEVYAPFLMSEEEVSSIVDFPTERGCGNGKGAGNGSGKGYAYGAGYSAGYSAGLGAGNGNGSSNGAGNGNGNSAGNGAGNGNGTGDGTCDQQGTGACG